ELVLDPRLGVDGVDPAREADLLDEELARLDVELALARRRGRSLAPRGLTLALRAVAHDLGEPGGETRGELLAGRAQALRPDPLRRGDVTPQRVPDVRKLALARKRTQGLARALDRQRHRQT